MAQSVAMRVDPEHGRVVPRVVDPAPPAPGTVIVRVAASRVCFADIGTSRNTDAEGPVTPGHEVAGTPAGGRVAVFGIGGLGHLAVQFAAKMGYEVVAIARGTREVPTAELTMKSIVLTGHLTGSAHDVEQTMRFALLNGCAR